MCATRHLDAAGQVAIDYGAIGADTAVLFGTHARPIGRQIIRKRATSPSIPRAVQKRDVRTLEPDQNVLRRRLRQAPVIVIRVHCDIDTVRPVLQGREDIAGFGQPRRLSLFDEGDVIDGIAEQPLVVRQQSPAGIWRVC